MKYVALLRGINVGKNKRLDMATLRLVFENLGYTEVASYINSGNIIFTTDKKINIKKIESAIAKRFGTPIPILIKSVKAMKNIAMAIPAQWKNDTSQRTDVIYLFDDIDRKNIIADLPINKEYVDLRYVKGAVILHLWRKNYSKSRLNKLIGCPYYQSMTIRNVNTARYLASI